ncbi:gamma-glutamyltransferase family protein [Amaricoccus sp.]|uniref:gamma-glutamyltransferase family protein n=1 Tax=Amaricoccus sp. TaxID=1872485 RepID=UPI001B7B1F31|nr:gamma-glutamyltransferase family protein [Amaricoccus sp.]MBP7002005.1 gamma-glutamyltransferase family protein [Amaricoccus sp.]
MRDFQTPGRSLVYAANGLCAASHPLAALTAVRLLQEGANAVDAAIAAALVLGIAEPHMTGIGGDLFVLLKPPGEERILGLNGSGRAPAGLEAAALRAAGHAVVPPDAAAAVTVPGAIDAFLRLSAEWGRIGREATLAPAIRAAEAGVPVAPRVALDWETEAQRLRGDARRFYLLDGRVPRVGQTFRAPGQAEVLRRIARDGRAGFYEGEVAEDMVASLRALGGAHTLDDFAATRCDWVEPVAGPYRGHEIVEIPPNGQGATAILLAGILGHFDLAALDPLGAERAHLEAEATKLAYDARDRFISDPSHPGMRVDRMLAPETAAALAALIDPGRAMADPARAAGAVHRETIYLTVVDRDRMAVSLIYSIYHGFGSGLASARFGINFQNRGAGFTLAEGHPNEAGPGKRPMHTIIPGMLRREGRLVMPFGVMGGAYQPTGHARLASNLLDFGMDPQAAIDAPRSFARDGVLTLEAGYAPEVAAALEARGHRVARAASPIGGAQAIVIDEALGVLVGASDPRKDGCALGY